MRQSRKAVGWTVFALCFYLAAEACVPPAWQPSARLSVALIHAYQSTGSHLMEAGGVHCRYTPTCSHYAEDAISYYGTLSGGLRAAGRIWRCSPWGGSGYDPAVEEHPAAYVAPPQETEEQRRQREQIQKDWEKAKKELGPKAAAGAAACSAFCILGILSGLVYLAVKIFCMIWSFKDAKARGDQNAILWPLMIFFLTPMIGMVVYMLARPKGELAPCPSCHQSCLETLSKCPHCNAEISRAGSPKPPAPPPAQA
jgi:putative membrane protein insertion efficiency factor